jgi:hypothetical protein
MEAVVAANGAEGPVTDETETVVFRFDKQAAPPVSGGHKSEKTVARISSLLIAVGMIISSLLLGAITASAAEPLSKAQIASSSAPSYRATQIPEWYQFCYDRTPGQQLQSTKSATPRHWYKNAIASSNGVECKYMYALLNFIPRTKNVTYTWTAVCKGMHKGNKGNWDAKKKMPYCTN